MTADGVHESRADRPLPIAAPIGEPVAVMAKKTGATARRKRERRNRWLIWVGVAVLAVAAVVVAFTMFGGGGGSSADSATVRRPTPVVFDGPATVDIDNIAYQPSVVRIPVGASVTWQFKDSVPHDVVEEHGLFKSEIQSDGEFSHTFDQAGTYFYNCSLHHKMTGTVIVAGSVTPTAGAPAATATPLPQAR